MSDFSIENVSPAGHPEVALVTVQGDMGTEVLPRVESRVNPLLDNAGVSYLVFDMTSLTYMNSRAVGMLMNYYGILKERGRYLVLVGLQGGCEGHTFSRRCYTACCSA